MNDPSQHEPDDELLSAYLDDELSTEDRALVESRLATDPAARQTLEQLRSVSQSVRDLPTESINRDLRESILLRAQVAKVDANSTASRAVPGPARTDNTLPNLTIGRTKRGWLWASLAVAAAILIMVLQPGREQDADLPNIAQHTHTPQSDKPSSTDSELSKESLDLAATNEPTPQPPAPGSTELAEVSPQSPPHVAEGRAGGVSADKMDSSTASGQPNSDVLALQPASEAPELKSAAPTAAPAAAQPSAGPDDQNNLPIVVHVLAKRAAFENKAFEDLLRRNDVELEPATRRLEAPASAAARQSASAASGRSEPQAPAAQDDRGSENVELVLVEAPQSTIFSCMTELNGDADNYLGVSVDYSSATTAETAAAESSRTKKLTTDLDKFNRGIVPSQQALSRDDSYYFKSADVDQSFSRGQNVSGGLGGYGRSEEKESLSRTAESNSDRGRARWLQRQPTEGSESIERSSTKAIDGEAPPADAQVQRQILDKAKSTVAANPERMQVLFVLRPSDEPAPSLKAKNRAE